MRPFKDWDEHDLEKYKANFSRLMKVYLQAKPQGEQAQEQAVKEELAKIEEERQGQQV